MQGLNSGKIKVCGDILVTLRVKKIWRFVGQKNGAFLGLCQFVKFSACGSFARHCLAFSGLFKAS